MRRRRSNDTMLFNNWRQAPVVSAYRDSARPIVVANGCFDMLHPGHVYLLEQGCRQAEERFEREYHLVVLLNSDDSVRRLKGPGRPMQDFAARAMMLRALSVVDVVIGFDEDTPEDALAALQPALLIKGDEYCGKIIPGANYVRDLAFVKMVEGWSTTAAVAYILNRKDGG